MALGVDTYRLSPYPRQKAFSSLSPFFSRPHHTYNVHSPQILQARREGAVYAG